MVQQLTLDQLYAHIDGLVEDLEVLNSYDDANEFIESSSLAHISDACIEFLESGYYSEIAKRLNLPPKLVNQFVRNFGPVTVKDATILGSKLLSYAKSLEGSISELDTSQSKATNKRELARSPNSVSFEALRVDAVQWVQVPRSNSVQELISTASTLMESIVVLSNSSNLPDAERVLTKIERAQLVAILETTLAILKAPMIEKGLLKKAGKGLGEVVEQVARKKSEAALGELATQAVKALGELLKLLT